MKMSITKIKIRLLRLRFKKIFNVHSVKNSWSKKISSKVLLEILHSFRLQSYFIIPSSRQLKDNDALLKMLIFHINSPIRKRQLDHHLLIRSQKIMLIPKLVKSLNSTKCQIKMETSLWAMIKLTRVQRDSNSRNRIFLRLYVILIKVASWTSIQVQVQLWQTVNTMRT